MANKGKPVLLVPLINEYTGEPEAVNAYDLIGQFRNYWLFTYGNLAIALDINNLVLEEGNSMDAITDIIVGNFYAGKSPDTVTAWLAWARDNKIIHKKG